VDVRPGGAFQKDQLQQERPTASARLPTSDSHSWPLHGDRPSPRKHRPVRQRPLALAAPQTRCGAPLVDEHLPQFDHSLEETNRKLATCRDLGDPSALEGRPSDVGQGESWAEATPK
jgi:hypothetical protein